MGRAREGMVVPFRVTILAKMGTFSEVSIFAFKGVLRNAKQVRKPWLYRRGGPCALPADQSSYSKEIFGEFVQSANSPNIFSRQYSVLPGGGEPLPYGGDWAMRLFCNSPLKLLPPTGGSNFAARGPEMLRIPASEAALMYCAG